MTHLLDFAGLLPEYILGDALSIWYRQSSSIAHATACHIAATRAAPSSALVYACLELPADLQEDLFGSVTG